MRHKTIPTTELKRDFLIALVVVMISLGCTAAAVAQAPSCNVALVPGCLYFPTTVVAITTSQAQTTYADVAGAPRTISFAIRMPVGLAGPLPVVIWSHGGREGKSNPLNSGVEWSETLSHGGYIVVSIAHEPRSFLQQASLCNQIGFSDPETCLRFNYLDWDRPYDIRAVIDELERLNILPGGGFFHRFDLDHLAVAGHSAGSGGTLSVAGAVRDFANGATFAPFDLRPKVFMAFSPQQPGVEGFFDTGFRQPHHSWEFINRPVLLGTGDGDNLCDPHLPAMPFTPGDCRGDSPYGRRIPFERMAAASNKYRLYLHDSDAFHEMFDLNVSSCISKGVTPAKCLEFGRDLSSVAFAFLDSYLKGNAIATVWLNSNNIEIATMGVGEYSRK